MSGMSDIGDLIQRCDLPPASGADALEARTYVVQEVPRQVGLRFFLVRGDTRVPISTHGASALLREYKKPVSLIDLTHAELLAIADANRAEADRMRVVYEAAKTWRADKGEAAARDLALAQVVDAALAVEAALK